MKQTGAKVEWVFVGDQTGLLEAPSTYPLDRYALLRVPRPGLHPNRAAKFPKMNPWDYVNAPKSIWIDGSFRVTSPMFARDMLDTLELTDIAQFEHPWRDCVYDEAAETLRLPRYADVHSLIPAQMDKYRNLFNHPEHWGLWAAGVIARNHTEKMKVFGEMWLNENLGHSYQDQLSQAPLLKLNNLRPFNLFGTHFSNPWLSYEGSGRHN